MPLIRRLPKRGFNNAAFHRRYAIINLDDLNSFKAGTAVNEQLLRDSKLVRGDFVGIKILGDGELKHGLTVEADQISATAREKIEKAGGTITLRERAAKPAVANRVEEAEASSETATPKGGSESVGTKKSRAKSSGKAKSRGKKKASQEP